MIPTAFDEENCVFDPPPNMTNSVESLSTALAIWRDLNVPCVISCWKPTPEEFEEIKKTGRVWLVVMGTGMAPILPLGHNPYTQQWVENVSC